MRLAGSGFGHEPPPEEPEGEGKFELLPEDPQAAPVAPAEPEPDPQPGFKIVGVKAEESGAKGMFGRFTSKLKKAVSGGHADDVTPPAEESREPEPPKEEAPAPTPSPVSAPASGYQVPKITNDSVLLRVGENQGLKAKRALARANIHKSEIEGDELRFSVNSNRFGRMVKALVDAKIDIFLLERTTGDPLAPLVGPKA